MTSTKGRNLTVWFPEQLEADMIAAGLKPMQTFRRGLYGGLADPLDLAIAMAVRGGSADRVAGSDPFASAIALAVAAAVRAGVTDPVPLACAVAAAIRDPASVPAVIPLPPPVPPAKGDEPETGGARNARERAEHRRRPVRAPRPPGSPPFISPSPERAASG